MTRQCAIVIACAFLAASSVVRAETLPEFRDANQQFSAGQFRAAIDGYETLVRAGHAQGNLFYNLANAYFRAGDSGRAILNYERALALESNHPEARTNLRIVRDEARVLELRKGWRERVGSFVTATQSAVTATAAFWVMLFLVALLWRAPRRSSAVLFLLVVCLVAFVGGLVGLYAAETGSEGRDVAIVTAKDVQARLATADNAAAVLALPPGSEVTLVSTRGDWVYVKLPNESAGWIPAGAAEPVRM